LQELLALKTRQIEEHNKIKPAAVPKPAAELTEEQQAAAAALDGIAGKLKSLEETTTANANTESLLAGKLKAIQNVRERLRLLERSYKQFQDATAKDLVALGLQVTDLATLTLNSQSLDQLATAIPGEQATLKTAAGNVVQEKAILLTRQTALNAKLNAPQLLYQQNLEAIKAWEGKLIELTGAPDAPETLKGLQARIAQLERLPDQLNERRVQRVKVRVRFSTSSMPKGRHENSCSSQYKT
jgi:hypothetical protein